MKQFINLLAFLAAIYAGFEYGARFGAFLWNGLLGGPGQLPTAAISIAGGIALFLLIHLPTSRVILRGLPNIGIALPTTAIRRRAIGFAANTALIAAVSLVLFCLWVGICHLLIVLMRDIDPESSAVFDLVISLASVLFVVPGPRGYRALMAMLRHALGTLFSSAMRLLRVGDGGRGGSARFAGLFTDWASRWTPGRILLGSSTYTPRHPVGLKDDRHLLTIAASAAGKGRSAIIPNLLSWPGSAIVIDPKGTNAAVTAASRGSGGGRVVAGMGQAVYVFDPFGVTRGMPGVPAPIRFNPMADIEPGGLTFYEDCDRVADSLVIPGKGSSDSDHWDGSARALLRGLIAHVSATLGPEGNLGHVRDLLTQRKGPPLAAMFANVRAGALAREAAAQLMAASDREVGSIISTAIRHTGWLASEAMRDALSTAEFRFETLKESPATFYAVLPPHYLHTHARALRAVVNAGIGAATKGGRSKTPILFILDEFYALGRMESLITAIANIRSYNVRLWPILQNLSQLEDLYGRNWTSFWANTGQVQVFATNDKATQEHIAAVLGKTLVWDRDAQGQHVSVGRAQLRDAQEIAREVSRAGGRQIIFREGDDPLVLKRLNYDEAFPRDAFNPDPDHGGAKPPFWKRVRFFDSVLPAPNEVMPIKWRIGRAKVLLVKAAEVKAIEVKPEPLPAPRPEWIKTSVPYLALVPIDPLRNRAPKDRGPEGR